jgi:multiple sugar transport system ATP-binding protein
LEDEMSEVRFEHVTKNFGDTVAVSDLNLEIPDKEFLVLVGPSGCGKTTALRLLSGLEDVTEGKIYIGDRLVNNVSPKDRDIAMVFQSYALYPHMSVYNNMAFGLRLKKTPKAEIERRVREAAHILGIEELLKRKPRQLSGGQRQRVALGRAIVREPAAFLLDEPLSNLDAKLRVQTRTELSKLHQRLGTTFIYVTHDQVEAMTMATRIAVMNQGVLQQVGTPQELYDRPVNVFVAGFIGSPAMNFFDVTVSREDKETYLQTDTFRVNLPPDKAAHLLPAYPDGKLVMGIRPEHIYAPDFMPPGVTAAPVRAKVDVTEMMGNEVFVYLVSGERQFLARLDPRARLNPGQEIDLVFNMDAIHLFNGETDEAIYVED